MAFQTYHRCDSVTYFQGTELGFPREEVVVAGPLVHVMLGPVLAGLQGGGGYQPSRGPDTRLDDCDEGEQEIRTQHCN